RAQRRRLAMKIRAKALPRVGRLAVALLALGAVEGASSAEQPRFRIEIQAEAEGGPKFTLTNLSDKTLTACHLQFSVSPNQPEGGLAWDPLVEAGDPRRPRPLEPGASLRLSLAHRVGGPLPDKIEVIAGIWADGGTFGDAAWVKLLLEQRAGLTAAYEQALA